MLSDFNGNIEDLIELVHFLSYGSGLSYKDIYNWLHRPIEKEDNRTAIKCVEEDGRAFINRLKLYVNNMEEASRSVD